MLRQSIPLCAVVLAAACSEANPQRAEPTSGGLGSSESSGSTGGDPSSSGGPSSTTVGSTGYPGETSSDGTTSESGTEHGADESSESSSSGEPIPSCDETTHRCVPPPPDGWSGPVALVVTAAESAGSGCEGEYGITQTTGFGGLLAPEPTCTCECGSPQDVECGDETSVLYYPPDFPTPGVNASDCITPAAAVEISNLEAFAGASPSRWRANPVEASGGTCTPLATSEVVPAAFSGRVDACAPADPVLSCEDGTLCMPEPQSPLEAMLCIWRDGENTCSGEYSVDRTMHTGFADSRSCSACSCGDPTGATCDDSSLWVWTGFDSHELVADGDCRYLGNFGAVTALNFDPGPSSGGSCQPSGGIAQGGSEPTGPITICCDS